jgi:hypothetical protein
VVRGPQFGKRWCRGLLFILITLSSTPLKELTRHTDLYMTTHNTHKRQTSMPTPGFEPLITAPSELRVRMGGLFILSRMWHRMNCLAMSKMENKLNITTARNVSDGTDTVRIP